MTAGTQSIAESAAAMIARGVRRVHVLAWRDLDDPDAGGSEVHADHFMRRWASAGLEITHRTSAAAGLAAVAQRNGYRVVRRGSRYSVFPRAVLAEIAGAANYDALVEIWNGVPWFSPLWSRKPKLTFLHHVHGPMWDQLLPGPFAAAGRWMETRLAPALYRRQRVLTPSEATRAELLGLGLHPERVRAIPNGVEDDFIPGVRAPEPLVVAVGRLAPVKRHAELIDAVAEARARVPGVRLVIVGEGPLRAGLEAQIERLGAQGWVRLAGHVPRAELIALYQQAWLVASSSLAEGWGLSLTEAAACATPCVATDISGHRSSVVDGQTGVLVPLGRLGQAIAEMLADDRRREALGSAARARARTLTWEASATAILAELAAQLR